MEAVYEQMNQKNIWYRTKPVVNSDLGKGRCVAAYSVGDWYLQPSFQRLLTRVSAIVGDKACFFKAVPYQSDGLLHQTLLQFIKFESYPHAEQILLEAMNCVADVLLKAIFPFQSDTKVLFGHQQVSHWLDFVMMRRK